MSSVQFRGLDAVIEGYEKAGMPGWVLRQGSKDLPFRFEGDSMADGAAKLQEILEMFGTGSNAVYTLRLFEKAGKISPKAQEDGSFNFRLNLDDQIPTMGSLQAYGRNNEVISRLAAIEERLKEEEDDEDEEDNGFGQQLLGAIKDPAMLQALIAGIQSLFMNKQQPATALAGVKEPTAQEAIDLLSKHVPDFGALLVKLARLAEKQPQQFGFYMAALRNMNV